MNEAFSNLNKKLESQSSLHTILSNFDIAKHIRSIQKNETPIASIEMYRNPLYFKILNQKTKEFLAILKTKTIVYASPEKLTIEEYMQNKERKFTQEKDELNSYFNDYDNVYNSTVILGGKISVLFLSIFLFLLSFITAIYVAFVFLEKNKYPLFNSMVICFTLNLALNVFRYIVF